MKRLLFLLLLLPAFSLSAAPKTAREVLEETYMRLWQVTGLNEDPPEVRFISTNSRGAFIAHDHGKFTVYVEEKVYEICMSFGDRGTDALAYILGHEIAHYSSGHQWGSTFVSTYGFNDVSGEIDTAVKALSRLPYWETQADLKGGIYCYMAGFNPHGIGDTLLQALYAVYPWNPEGKSIRKSYKNGQYEYDTIKPYPSLEERLAIASLNDSLVSTLVQVFEAGNLAMVIGRYDDAIQLLEFTLKRGIKSREVYNNLGVVYAQQAIKALGNNKVTFAYPFELDLQSRISYTTKGVNDEAVALLEKALIKFRQAYTFDPDYATALTNMAGVYSLLGELRKAQFYAEEAINLADEKHQDNTLSNAKVMLGIVLVQQDNKKSAQKLFETEIENGNLMASVNLEIIKGGKLNKLKPGFFAKSREDNEVHEAQFGNMDGVDLYGNFNIENYKTIPVFYGMLYVSDYPHSKLFYWMGERDNHPLIMQKSGEDFDEGSVWGIKRGSSFDELKSLLGNNYKMQNTSQGILIHYPLNQVVFLVDSNQQVESWMIYRLDA